ncbi:NUDIX hydrolase [Arcanobacterium bovis]|uniref:NUDIX hydrolase n=1 Tax=Arcanobacterium bovis TaxID=2529275 RepID=UPI0013F15A8E|nr:NUDIX domain-containing protein [Arcanobacterium bovis]
MKTRKRADIYAAGALVWRVNEGKLEVLIVHRPRWNDWSFPKGKVKSGETLRACCVRELYEEGAVHVVLGRPLGWQRYVVADGRSKAVHFWCAQVTSNDDAVLKVRPKVSLALTSEVDQRRWVSVRQARRLLTSSDDRKMLTKLAKYYDHGELTTAALIILRHAKAVKRELWKNGAGPEYTRPLASSGKKRLPLIASDLGAYGISEVLSSPWKRCKDTVKDYARATASPLRTQIVLTERGYVVDPQDFAQEIADVVDEVRNPCVICLHRPTLALTFSTLAEFASRSVVKTFPEADPWLKPGDMFVVHIASKPGKAKKILATELITSDFE